MIDDDVLFIRLLIFKKKAAPPGEASQTLTTKLKLKTIKKLSLNKMEFSRNHGDRSRDSLRMSNHGPVPLIAF
jgi:hypothetical protein